jgi:D-xylose transport system substrate-binding protein
MSSRSTQSTVAALAIAMVVAMGLAACGGDDDDGSADKASGEGGSSGKKIALLLPETKTTRYEEKDRPLFTAKVEELCPDCEVIYANATQDPNKQQQQAEAAITNGADVIVLDAVDVKSVGPIVQHANQEDIPVIAYDRLIPDQDIAYYVSFDNVKQGRIQAQTLLDKLGSGADGESIVMVNGAPTDPSAGDYKKGAHQVFDKSGVKIAKEYDTPDWSPDKAQVEMEQSITALGKDGFVGAYSANDGMAGGMIAAMKSAGIDPSARPITGGDSEAAAIQRILTGEQYSTIYLAIKQQAETSAQIAVAAAQGKDAPADVVDSKVDNGAKQVPSVLLSPIAVTKDNINDTVIKDGFLTVDEICTGSYKAACEEAGIQ